MNKETKTQRLIMLALSEAGCTVWRNETAGAWVGKVIHKAGDQVTLSGARMMPFGLCVGSSDIIGITPSGKFLAIEVKTKSKSSKASDEQLLFKTAVLNSGGVAGIARSPEDALNIIKGHTND